MRILLAVVLLVAVGLCFVGWQTSDPIVAAPVVPTYTQESEVSNKSEHPQPERVVAVADKTKTPELARVSELVGLYEKNISFVNKVLRRAGRKEVSPDSRISNEALDRLTDMVLATNKAINDAADGVLEYQRPYAKKMAATLKRAVDGGKKVPYTVLPNGVLPDPKPYELFVTSSYKGVVYLQTIPITAELMEIVDRQKFAEALRIDAFTGFAAELNQ